MKVLARTICLAVGIAGMTGAANAHHHYFYANCFHESHGYRGYNSHRYPDVAGAERDCAEHLRIYPRHRCTIKPVDY